MKNPVSPPKKRAGLSDDEIIARVRAGEVDLFELLMRRYNQLVFRIGRAVLRDNARAEDLAQEAWARVRRDRRFDAGEAPTKSASGRPNPESAALAGEVRSLLEAAVDALPDDYRVVFMLREIEELSTKEAAHALELTEQAVKTRLHRARGLLRCDLVKRAGSKIRETFPFLAKECDRIVHGVLARIETRASRIR